MNKRNLLILAIVILLGLLLMLKLRSPSATEVTSKLGISSSTAPAKPPAVAMPTAKPVAASSVLTADIAKPAAGGVPSEARKANLHQIATANLAYMFSDHNSRTLTAQPGDTAHSAAYELARVSFLNEAAVYFVPGDPKAPNPRPQAVILGDIKENPEMNPDFANATLSIEMAANIPPNAPGKTTPIAWSRGLRDDGTWAADSPFGGTGGYVTYLDGHTEWVEKFSTVMFGTTATTHNIREALPPGAVILSAEPKGQGH